MTPHRLPGLESYSLIHDLGPKLPEILHHLYRDGIHETDGEIALDLYLIGCHRESLTLIPDTVIWLEDQLGFCKEWPEPQITRLRCWITCGR